jgi:hypothetical protein
MRPASNWYTWASHNNYAKILLEYRIGSTSLLHGCRQSIHYRFQLSRYILLRPSYSFLRESHIVYTKTELSLGFCGIWSSKGKLYDHLSLLQLALE